MIMKLEFNKKNILLIFVFLFGIFLIYSVFQYSLRKDISPDSSSLTESEIEGLLLMREEEKLARDVYLTLGKKWNLPIFSNIARSEQTHMDMVKDLLDKYNIPDPVKDNSIGVFSNKKLDVLYNQLVEKGNKSLLDALLVGATVEDLDIKDLQDLLEDTQLADISFVYENLMRGSRNHLRAYVRQIEQRGGKYTPKYISRVYYQKVIDSSQEKGFSRN